MPALQNFSVGVGGRYVSRTERVNSTEGSLSDKIIFDKYYTFRAGLYYNLKQVSIALNVNNIFDERYFLGGLNAARVYPGTPRNYIATIRYSF